MSPCSNATSTSSLTSGSQINPRLAPAIGEARRAHVVATPSVLLGLVPSSHGNLIFTRPRVSGSLLSVTTPTTTDGWPVGWVIAPAAKLLASVDGRRPLTTNDDT